MPASRPETSPETSSEPAVVSAVSHDVVIVGGGLVGASLAIALDRAGTMDIGLVEASPPGGLPAVFDQRNLSFADATVNALTALGVLQHLRAPAGEIRRIHVSRAGDPGRVKLDAASYGRERFGLVVVASDLGEALEGRLAECTRVTRYRPARFIGFESGAPGTATGTRRLVRIAQDAAPGQPGERVIGAKLVVAADGTHSAVRTALGIDTEVHDYAQSLLVARVRATPAPDGTAYERFRADGPTALLPRGDRHYGAIHAVASADAAAVLALDDIAFLQRLQHAFGWRAGRFLAAGPRSLHPALRVVARTTVAPRAVLVGNAAQTLHPVGAQGFNLGLRDALTLAELVEAEGIDAVGADPEPGLLAHYASRRREDRARTLAFSDGLARLTSNSTALGAGVRTLGLFAADRMPALQAWLVGGAMGYRGDVPALCRVGAA